MELLQYLEMEQGWLNTLEEKVTATDNLPESTEAVGEALEVHTHTHKHTHILYITQCSGFIHMFS